MSADEIIPQGEEIAPMGLPPADQTVKPVPLSQARQTGMICVFCHNSYEGKPDSCPSCKKPFPKGMGTV